MNFLHTCTKIAIRQFQFTYFTVRCLNHDMCTVPKKCVCDQQLVTFECVNTTLVAPRHCKMWTCYLLILHLRKRLVRYFHIVGYNVWQYFIIFAINYNLILLMFWCQLSIEYLFIQLRTTRKLLQVKLGPIVTMYLY